MKTTFINTPTTTDGFIAGTAANILEGAPAGLAKVKTADLTTVTERPNILTRRGMRWKRRASH